MSTGQVKKVTTAVRRQVDTEGKEVSAAVPSDIQQPPALSMKKKNSTGSGRFTMHVH